MPSARCCPTSLKRVSPVPVIGIDASRLSVPQRTGTEHYTHELLQAMVRYAGDDSMKLYVNSSRPPSDLPALGEPICIPARRFWTIGRLAGEMLRRPPDLLFVPAHIIPPIHPASVMTIHDLGYLTSAPFHPPSHRAWLDLSTRRSIASAVHLIAVSETTKRDLIERYEVPPSRVTVIYHGVRRPPTGDVSASESGIRERIGATGPFILAVGTIQPRKNYRTLIEAVASLRQKGFPHQVVIAGKPGWDSAAFMRDVTRSGHSAWVHIVGYASPDVLDALYASAAVVAVPSFYEGFGLPALEAMARGTPTVVSNRGALPEICGGAALYVDPFDHQSLAFALESVLSDSALASQLIARGHERVSNFSWDRAAKQTLTLLRSIAAEGARGGARPA